MEKIYTESNLSILTKVLFVCISKQSRIWPTKIEHYKDKEID